MLPLIFQPPSTFSAVVFIAPSTSVPPSGSVKPIEKRSLPSAIAGRMRSFCSSLPYRPIDLEPAKLVSPHTQLRPPSVRQSSRASTIWLITSPPSPPYSSGTLRPW